MSDLPRYGLAMIVRNEEANIRRCLESVKSHIGYYVISDTGSTDATMDIIREVLAGIPGELREDPWRNFGHNRSIVFAEIRGKCRWALALDADMELAIDPDFVPDPTVDAYMIEMGKHTDFSYRLPLLVRGDLPWISVGAVHEYTALEDGRQSIVQATDKVRIDMGDVYRGSVEKYQGYARLLEGMLAEDPDNPRTVYYLGQTYETLGDPRAREVLLRRMKMGGYAPEASYAAFMAAKLAPDWPTQMTELLAAWEMNPKRIEPLHFLVRGLNERGMHRAAYALASITPILCDDVLFVHRAIWDWGMKFEKSIAAWWVGYPAEAKVLCDELLANPRLPDYVREQVILNRSYSEV